MRNYYIAGSQHGNASPNHRQRRHHLAQQFGSGVDSNPLLRALFVALDQWMDGTRAAARATCPSTTDGTAVFAKPGRSPASASAPSRRRRWAIPTIPKVQYSGLITVRNQLELRADDSTPASYTSIRRSRPASIYPNSVSKVDADGNDIAGIRMPEVVAPVATHSGWTLRSAAFGGKADGTDGCEAAGQSIVFAPTMAARQSAGDPRLSLEERYGDRADLVAARTAAANALKAQRLLLQADVDAAIARAAQPIAVSGSPTYQAYSW